MSTIEIRVTDTVTVENFAQAAAEGTVQFYRVRGNGTTRHIPFYAEGSEAREVAEQVSEWREEGKTMQAIAADLHMSIPSVRRMLNSLLLSEEVDGYDEEEIAEILADAAEGDGTDATETLPAEAPDEDEAPVEASTEPVEASTTEATATA